MWYLSTSRRLTLRRFTSVFKRRVQCHFKGYFGNIWRPGVATTGVGFSSSFPLASGILLVINVTSSEGMMIMIDVASKIVSKVILRFICPKYSIFSLSLAPRRFASISVKRETLYIPVNFLSGTQFVASGVIIVGHNQWNCTHNSVGLCGSFCRGRGWDIDAIHQTELKLQIWKDANS